MEKKELSSVVDFLVSKTTTDDPLEVRLVYKDLYSKLGQYYPVYFDLIISTSISIERGLVVIYGENRGYYNYIDDVIQFNEASVFLHEAAHSAMQLCFNNTALPYPVDSINLKLEYKSAVNSVLYNIASKLGLQLESEDVVGSLNILKQESSLDLFSTIAMPSFTLEDFEDNYNQELGGELIASLHSKYVIDITYKNVRNLIIEQIKSKNLEFSKESIKTISILGRIIYLSSEEELYKELIATLPELYYEESADIEILFPMHDYWKDYIHPLVGADTLIYTLEDSELNIL